MPLQKLQFRPGINRETTSYSNEGGWFDMDKVRFRFGYPEKIGGWVKSSVSAFLGTCRALHPWVSLDGTNFLGVGTNLKYYLNDGTQYEDITPIRLIATAGDAVFSTGFDTIDGNLDATSESILLNSITGFPASGRIKIDSEEMTYAGISSKTLTGVTRAFNGTVAATHSSGAQISCATIAVAETDHGALVDDFVTFSGAASLGGAITAERLNQEYQITAVINSNVFNIEARTVSNISSITETSGLVPTLVFSNASDNSNGGSSVVATYQINTGLNTTVLGNGWNAGTWGRGTWNSSSDLTVAGQTLRIWSHDNFGEDLILNVRDGGLFYWDRTNGTNFRAVALNSLAGAKSVPTIAKQVLVSDRDRHVVAFGCDSEIAPGVQDPLLIRFSDQSNITDWQSLVTNTAGDLRIGSGSKIITAIETRQQILVFTDVSLHAMQFLGPPFTFGISSLSESITVASPLAAIAVEDNVFWMGAEEFYVYGGAVQRLPCSVRDYIFSNMNINQMQKITAGVNSAFGEVTWFYPSASSDENDSYVTYNYEQKVWSYGVIPRTVWLDRGVNQEPIAASPDHYLYLHEIGFDDGSTSPATAITSFIESSQLDLGEGEQFAFMRRLIPDMTFRNSTANAPSATMTLKVRNFPGGNYLDSNASSVAKTASIPVEQFTEQVFVRLRGRSFAFRIESDNTGVTWRLGSPRVDIRPDGRR